MVTPILVTIIVRGGPTWSAFGMWAVIACTDGLDGWVARRQGTTRSGAFLDPLADKVCVLGAMAALVWRGDFWWVPVGVIAAREFAIVAYRSMLVRRGVTLPASRAAKAKTAVQSLAVAIALLPSAAARHTVAAGVLWIAVVLTIQTGVHYVIDGARPAVDNVA
jgi:CDP-diacylglycerol--glycerol-3-phosphate 3-phosphatidyltransferase